MFFNCYIYFCSKCIKEIVYITCYDFFPAFLLHNCLLCFLHLFSLFAHLFWCDIHLNTYTYTLSNNELKVTFIKKNTTCICSFLIIKIIRNMLFKICNACQLSKNNWSSHIFTIIKHWKYWWFNNLGVTHFCESLMATSCPQQIF